MKRATDTTCTAPGGCSFEVDVTNTGTEPVAGPSSSKKIDGTGASLAGGPNAPEWALHKGLPNLPSAGSSPASHPGPLAANGRPAGPARTLTTPATAIDSSNCAVAKSDQALPPDLAAAEQALPSTTFAINDILVDLQLRDGKCTAGGKRGWDVTITNVGRTMKSMAT